MSCFTSHDATLRVPPYNPGVDPVCVVSPEVATASGVIVASGTVDDGVDVSGTTDDVNGLSPVVFAGVRCTGFFGGSLRALAFDADALADAEPEASIDSPEPLEGIKTTAAMARIATTPIVIHCRPPTVWNHFSGGASAARKPPGGPGGGPVGVDVVIAIDPFAQSPQELGGIWNVTLTVSPTLMNWLLIVTLGPSNVHALNPLYEPFAPPPLYSSR
jgi:hypothetical protein